MIPTGYSSSAQLSCCLFAALNYRLEQVAQLSFFFFFFFGGGGGEGGRGGGIIFPFSLSTPGLWQPLLYNFLLSMLSPVLDVRPSLHYFVKVYTVIIVDYFEKVY